MGGFYPAKIECIQTLDETTSSGQYVRGSFYESNREEAGGVFSSTNFHGAFGATRQ